MLVNTDLNMAGYRGDAVPAMQKRMIDAMETIPGVSVRGIDRVHPPLDHGVARRRSVFADETTDLRPSNAAARPFMYNISPGYFHAAGTSPAVRKGLHVA